MSHINNFNDGSISRQFFIYNSRAHRLKRKTSLLRFDNQNCTETAFSTQ